MRLTPRELGIEIGAGTPGPFNAITDVPGVEVGHCTLNEGSGPLRVGQGPIRTGVTVVRPSRAIWEQPVFAGCHRLNGNGELTGLEWVRESGMLTSPVALTNTHSVGVVRDALVANEVAARGADGGLFWGLPVVGETWDGMLNDLNGFHVRPEHVEAALADASTGRVEQGAVGSGTGMISHGFKGGIGSSSRVVEDPSGEYVVGVLVQANHGRRPRFAINGAPIGLEITADEVPTPEEPGAATDGAGSIIVVVATDAPLLPHQCRRLAQRSALGIARTGGLGEHSSGDLMICFSTGNSDIQSGEIRDDAPALFELKMLPDARISALFEAVVETTEEAIVSAIFSAETVVGRDGITAHAIPSERALAVLDRYHARSRRVG